KLHQKPTIITRETVKIPQYECSRIQSPTKNICDDKTSNEGEEKHIGSGYSTTNSSEYSKNSKQRISNISWYSKIRQKFWLRSSE
ncbi:MAG: hypothetical protein MHPSP_004548, partial [Paramarteilia canceri]